MSANTTKTRNDPPQTINGISSLLAKRMQRTEDTTAFIENKACEGGKYTMPYTLLYNVFTIRNFE